MSSIRTSIIIVLVGLATVVAAAQKSRYTAPETFTSALQAATANGAGAGTINIQVDRYTHEQDRKRMSDALTHGGYSGFLQALRAAPTVGGVTMGDQKFAVRWAREEVTDKGRNISIVTDKPIYFVGGGRPDAKPRAGFEIAVVQLTVDNNGLGTGTMAAAAKVRPDGKGGVLLDDYAEQPIKLPFVHRVIK
jgi:hypothetical protein